MIRNLLLTALLLGRAASSVAQPAPVLDERVRQLATTKVASGAYPGLVIGFVNGDRQEIVGFGTVGKVSGDPKRTRDASTLYEIGSVTKTFTALLLADAVQRGETSLDQPAQRLLPGYTIPRSGERRITLLDLATQSSGLPRLPDNLLPKTGFGALSPESAPETSLVADDQNAISSPPMNRRPGEG